MEQPCEGFEVCIREERAFRILSQGECTRFGKEGEQGKRVRKLW